jgi:hypothetical protein
VRPERICGGREERRGELCSGRQERGFQDEETGLQHHLPGEASEVKTKSTGRIRQLRT